MRNGGEKRGNSKDRAARKTWMLQAFGNGQTCPCVHCGTPLTYATVQADRIVPGGSYRRDNIQPSCAADNRERSNRLDWVPPKFRQQLALAS
jgi:hypothetical protein